MADTDLRDVLDQCQASAKVGYEIASKREQTLREVLSVAETRIQGTIFKFASSHYYSPDTDALLDIFLPYKLNLIFI